MKKILLIFLFAIKTVDVYCQNPILPSQYYDSTLYRLFPQVFACEEFMVYDGVYDFTLEWMKPVPNVYKLKSKTIDGITYHNIIYNSAYSYYSGTYFHKGREYLNVHHFMPGYFKSTEIFLRYENNKVFILNDTIYTHWINAEGDTTFYDTSKVERESLLFDFCEEENTVRFLANNKIFFRKNIQLIEKRRWHNNLTGDTILTYLFTPQEEKIEYLTNLTFEEIRDLFYIKAIRISKKDGIVEIAINYKNSWGDYCRCRPHDPFEWLNKK